MKMMMNILTAIILSAGSAGSVAAQDVEKTPAAAIQSQDVKFDGHGVSLAGTLTLPKAASEKKLPGVLVIVGSGPTPRDGVSFGSIKHPIYREISEYLASQGMAVLRYDKRCVGASECKIPDSFDDYIDDARGGVKFLRSRAEIDPQKIFLFGHSEGGLIAASIAVHEESKYAGVILAATAGRTLGKVLREQLENRMKEQGKPEAEVTGYLAKYDRVIRNLMSGRVGENNEKLDPKDPYDAILLSLVKQYQIVISLLVNDPLQIVNGIESPVLIIQGKKDIQVAVKDAQFLEEALKRAYHPDTTLHLLDDVDHLLKTNKGAASLASYQDSSRPVDAGMLKIIGEWIGKRAKAVSE